MKDSEIFREARNVLFERGWGTGHWGTVDGDGPVCLEGAVNCAAMLSLGEMLVHSFAMNSPVLREACGGLIPFSFNDSPERTFDEVIDALERAEKLALIREESK